MKRIFNSFEKSLKQFQEILEAEKSVMSRDAAIQRFEFTLELSWKVIQKFLREQEIICRSPKECLEAAFSFKLLEDNSLWFEAFKDRNLTVHTYSEETAERVYDRLSGYLKILNELKDCLNEKMANPKKFGPTNAEKF